MYRINTLLKQRRKLFHTSDLRLMWGITNQNTLYTLIKRYVQKGILKTIHKGFYAVLPIEKIDPVELGISFLHGYAYLSGEYVLSHAGIIFQSSDYITLISAVSKKFTIGENHYWVRKLKDEYLYCQAGVIARDDYLVAIPERAAADLLHYNSHYHFDNRKGLDSQKIKNIQKEMGYR